MQHAWRALRHRNFQLFFVGQGISVVGTWMTRVATSWLVYRLTHSALLLGVVSFAGQIVSFALGPVAGVWVERLDRRKLLVWTQAAAAVQSLALAALTLVGFGMMQAAAVSNTVIQSLVPEDKRARVMGYYTMAFFGASPFGSLFAGALAHRIGAPTTVMLTGACCIAGAVWFTLDLPKVRAVMRPIYQQMGLIPNPE